MKRSLILSIFALAVLSVVPGVHAKEATSKEKTAKSAADVDSFTKLRLEYAKKPDFTGD